MVLYSVWECWKGGIDPEKSVVFVSYLGAQVDYGVHILQFRSTHQYCRTAKYEPDRTIGCEDRWYYRFRYSTFSQSNFSIGGTMVESDLWWVDWNLSGGIYNVIYLHHQWSDQAHTLQFDSTDEYFETVEYEPRSPLELRDSSRKPLIFLDRSPHIQQSQTLWITWIFQKYRLRGFDWT